MKTPQLFIGLCASFLLSGGSVRADVWEFDRQGNVLVSPDTHRADNWYYDENVFGGGASTPVSVSTRNADSAVCYSVVIDFLRDARPLRVQPFERPIERGRPGPGLLAHVLVSKYADHLPLYRQSQIFDREGLDLDRSTLADWVGKATALLEPLAEAIGRHVLSAEAIFADDTPVQMLAPGTGKTQTALLWTYARDERPWGGDAPPAAWYRFSGDRRGQHPKDHLARFRGWMHADGYAGLNDLYRTGAIREVACMAHVRRKFVDIHRSQGFPIAEEAIGRIARLYAIEKEARGSPPDRRAELRKALFDDLEVWLAMQLTTISGKSPLAVAIRHALNRMERLRPYLDHGILELDNNTAERGMRAIALGRKNYLFVGSEAGGKAAAIAYTLVETAKLNAVDPHAWLANTIARIPDYKIIKVDDLLPWRWNG